MPHKNVFGWRGWGKTNSFQRLTFCKCVFSEITRIQKGETKKEEEDTYLDLFTTKNVKVKERVLIPVKQYPKVSVVGTVPIAFVLG